MVEIPPGAQTGWHKHPYPCFAYILSGSLTVEMEGGKVHELTAGQAMAESVNVMHNGKNTGEEPVKLVMFVMGEREKPFTERAPK
jgi:quercetin dioxygenase-like cupin family protein